MKPKDPVELVQFFLASMQARELETAGHCLHPEFVMTFPGGARFTTLQELIEWSVPRYQKIAKRIERCEQTQGDSSVTVWCFGTLYGQYPDGEHFADVRFVDRFALRDGLLHTQQVWNDLAEVTARRSAT